MSSFVYRYSTDEAPRRYRYRTGRTFFVPSQHRRRKELWHARAASVVHRISKSNAFGSGRLRRPRRVDGMLGYLPLAGEAFSAVTNARVAGEAF